MALFETPLLLEQLKNDVEQIKTTVTQQFGELTPEQLNMKPSAERWSLAECLEHVNRYSRYYLPLLRQGIQNASKKQRAGGDMMYHSSWLGDYFVRSMLPKEGVVKNKMKTMTSYNPVLTPSTSNLDGRKCYEEFLKHQVILLDLLNLAGSVNMERIKVPLTLSKWVRLRIGDVFRFLIAHEQRHLLQLENTWRDLSR